jgi:hypothetical protein
VKRREEEESLHAQGGEASLHHDGRLKKVTISSMSGVPKFNTFRMKGVVQGQRATMLIGGGDSHNFIDMDMVERRHIPTADFEGFLVEVAGRRTMDCDGYIPQMSLNLRRYTLTHDFYVVDIPNTNIILGVKCWVCVIFFARHIFAGFEPTYYRRADIFPGPHDIRWFSAHGFCRWFSIFG